MAAEITPPLATGSHRRIAVALSVVPGAGQVYNGRPAKGLRLFLATVGSIVLSFVVLLRAIGAGPSVYNSFGLLFLLLALGAIVVFLTGFITGLFLWASAFTDAYEDGGAASRSETSPRIHFFRL